MDIEALSSTLADASMCTCLPGVELSLVKSMDWYVKDWWIIVEDLRRAVAHMDIPVKDAYFACTVFTLSRPRSYSDIIKEAEAGNLVAVCVMAGRAHDGKSLIY